QRKKNEIHARVQQSCVLVSGRKTRHWKMIFRFSDCPNCPRRTNWPGVERVLRTFDIIMIAAMLVAATVTYTIKYDAEKQIAVIAKLKRQIDSEKDTITLLRADWALMNQPGRLQSLVGVYEKELNLQ